MTETPTLRTDLELARAAVDPDDGRRTRAARDLYAAHGLRVAAFLARRLPAVGPGDPAREFWTSLFSKKSLARYDGTVPLSVFLLEEAEGWAAQIRRPERESREEDPEVLERLYGGGTAMEGGDRALVRAASRALVLLAETWPEDAALVRGRLLGLSFGESARRELSPGAPEAEVQGRAREMEERFNRPGTGAWAKFSILLDRCLETAGESRPGGSK